MSRVGTMGLVAIVASAASATPPTIVDRAVADSRAVEWVASLVDEVGARPAGSDAAARAVDWAERELRKLGLDEVRREPVKFTRWVRGTERVELVAPRMEPLVAVGLGGSVATLPAGVEGEVIAVDSPGDLAAVGDKVRGKIVLYTKAMDRTRDFTGYGGAVRTRYAGAVEAARHGAIAALMRSAGTGLHRLAHTGATSRDPAPQIPFAALAAEDALTLDRMVKRGVPVRVRVTLASHTAPAASHNVVAELRGASKPEEIVLIGAHLDSWDVGSGALDDGAGVAMVIETMRLLAAGPRPARTVRAVLFMNEEMGLSGAKAYAESHAGELARHVAAMEADAGAGAPIGFAVRGGPDAVTICSQWLSSLSRFRLAPVTSTDEAGADLLPLEPYGVPAVALLLDVSDYFEWHHTAGDTVDKVDPRTLSLDAGLFAFAAQALADAPTTLSRAPTKAARDRPGAAPRR